MTGYAALHRPDGVLRWTLRSARDLLALNYD